MYDEHEGSLEKKKKREKIHHIASMWVTRKDSFMIYWHLKGKMIYRLDLQVSCCR